MAAYQGREGYPPGTWTKAIATLCKSLAPSQLVIAGDNGFLKCVLSVVASDVADGSLCFAVLIVRVDGVGSC